jgi:uncharacterized protein
MLEELIAIHERVVSDIPMDFRRYLYTRMAWDRPLTGIVGARGAGKTTLVLQHYKLAYNDVQRCLYLPADHPLVIRSGLYNAVAEYFKYYGECVIIDEVHKQPDWSNQIKALHDTYPGKKFILLGSSMLKILHEKGDLSRRLLLYHLKGLSFREYLNVRYQLDFLACPPAELLNNHVDLSRMIMRTKSGILGDFNQYLATGYYPYFIGHSDAEYFQLLGNVIDKVIYEDIPSTQRLKPSASVKMKRLLAYLSMSTIPTFSTASLTREIELSRDALYEYLDLLDRAELAVVIPRKSGNVRSVKHAKILLANANIYHAIRAGWWSHEVNRGNLRESFFSSQIRNDFRAHASMPADFSVDFGFGEYEIEVGGPGKNKSQVASAGNRGFVFKDGIEHGAGTTVPLYLAGFLY